MTLRRRRSRGKRAQTSTYRSRLCRCTVFGCGDLTEIDPFNPPNTIAGKYIGVNAYATHQQEQQLQNLRAHILPKAHLSFESISKISEHLSRHSSIQIADAASASSISVAPNSMSTSSDQLDGSDGPSITSVRSRRRGRRANAERLAAERILEFSSLRMEIRQRSRAITDTDGLVFETEPHVTQDVPVIAHYRKANCSSVSSDPQSASQGGDAKRACAFVREINSGPLRLRYDVLANSLFLHHEEWLIDSIVEVDAAITGGRDAVEATKRLLMEDLENELKRIDELKLAEWKRQHKSAKTKAYQDPFVVDTTSFMRRSYRNVNPISFIAVLLTNVLYLLCGVSILHLKWCIKTVKLAILLSFRTMEAETYQYDTILAGIPNSPQTAMNMLDIKPHCVEYICCPSCFALYDTSPGAPDYPERCENQDTKNSSKCGRLLRKSRDGAGGKHLLPARKYLYHDMKKWMASFLTREGIEELVDRDLSPRPGDEMHDIWDAPELQQFKGPDGLPFIRPNLTEGRYIFSLNMDGFNPYQMKESGKKVSVGAIYMVCLNLPPALRYRLENMFLVAIIPGPAEPSVHQINHLLRPLVNDLLDFWEPGVTLTSTPRFPTGRAVRCAVVPLVCDLPAARQMAGHASHSCKHFCSFCLLKKQHINSIGSEWKTLTWEEHKQIAEQWRDADDDGERAQIFEKHGIRYSELLRLPYWDPTRYVVLDSMHNLLLGNLKHHCRDIWGMDINSADGDGSDEPLVPLTAGPTEADLSAGFRTIRAGTNSELGKLSVPVLQHYCRELNTLPKKQKQLSQKKPLAEMLRRYRVARGWFNDAGTLLVPPARGEILGVVPGQRVFQAAPTPEEMEAKYASATTLNAIASLRKDWLVWLTSERYGYHPSELAKLVKDQLAKLLYSYRMTHPEDDNRYAIQKRRKKTKVLGKNAIKEIQSDLTKTSLPKWVAAVPASVGEPKAGKLTADQWKTFCCVHLVVSLVRLWGQEDKDSRLYKLLENFMLLITATKLASMRTMTNARADEYHSNMCEYLKSLLRLFEDISLLPNQHCSQHLSTHLKRFGPMHAWRTFAFERYNYVLQHIPTNRKFGELERTMFERFCMNQNIRVFLAGSGEKIPEVAQILQPSFEHCFGTRNRGTLETDNAFDEDEFEVHTAQAFEVFDDVVRQLQGYTKTSKKSVEVISLTRSTRKLLLDWVDENTDGVDYKPFEVIKLDQITLKGVQYQVDSSNGSRNAQVIIQSDGNEWVPGMIEAIFSLIGPPDALPTDFLILKKFAELPAQWVEMDIYRRFPISGGRVYLDEFDAQRLFVPATSVTCHFAGTKNVLSGQIARKHIHVLPLEKY